MVRDSRRRCYGPFSHSEGQIGQGLITVTESRDGYVRVYWCLISIRLYSVSCQPAILLHRAGICLTWKNHKRCHLCRGNGSRQGP